MATAPSQVRIAPNEISFACESDACLQRKREDFLAKAAAKRSERVTARDDRRAATASVIEESQSTGISTAPGFWVSFNEAVKCEH
jgi:hypothetical protein